MLAEYRQSACLELPLGAHLITPRHGFLHHGIYVGGENVVHYSGSTYGLNRGPVEEVSVDRFADGRWLWVRGRTPQDFDGDEVVRRARSRLGEDHYRLFSNNCEHFCEWCLHGEHRSYQVEALMSLPGRAIEIVIDTVASMAHRFKRVVQDGRFGNVLPLLIAASTAIESFMTLGAFAGATQMLSAVLKKIGRKISELIGLYDASALRVRN